MDKQHIVHWPGSPQGSPLVTLATIVVWKTGLMSEEENLEMCQHLDCLGYFLSPILMTPPILSSQMFPNLDHFVWELSVTKTSASPCVGIENPLFITLHPPPSVLTHVTMWKYFEEDEPIKNQVWKKKTNLEIRLLSHRCQHNGHRIAYCCRNESTENH